MSAANQRYEVQKRMQRFIKVLEETTANKETTDWRNLRSFPRRTFGREKHSDIDVNAENKRISGRLCDILTEDRKGNTTEYVPGWRIGTGGTVIDCYTTKQHDPNKFGFVQKMRKERIKQFKKRDERNVYLRTKINSVKSEYAVADFKEKYAENRRRAKAIIGKMPATKLHLGLLSAAINSTLAPKSPHRSPSPPSRPRSPSPSNNNNKQSIRLDNSMPYSLQQMNLGPISLKSSQFADENPPWDNSPVIHSKPGDSISTSKLYGSMGEVKPVPMDFSVNVIKANIDRIRQHAGSPIKNRPSSAPSRDNLRVQEIEAFGRRVQQAHTGHAPLPYMLSSSLQSTEKAENAFLDHAFVTPGLTAGMPKLNRPATADSTPSRGPKAGIIPNEQITVETLPKSLVEMRPDLFPPRALLLMEDRIDVRVQQLIGSEAVLQSITTGLPMNASSRPPTVPYIARIADVGLSCQAKFLQPSSRSDETPDTIIPTSTGLMIEVTLAEHEDQMNDPIGNQQKYCRVEHFVSMKQLRRLAYRCGLNKLAVTLRSIRSRDKAAGLHDCIANNIDAAAEQELCDMVMRCVDVVHIEHCELPQGDLPSVVLRRQPVIAMVVDDS